MIETPQTPAPASEVQATGFRLRPETQQIVKRGFDVIDALRSGKITPTEANKLAKVLREWRRHLNGERSIS
jgi:hypothetical protein